MQQAGIELSEFTQFTSRIPLPSSDWKFQTTVKYYKKLQELMQRRHEVRFNGADSPFSVLH